jgi:A/G-specific adenine glycosylase
MAGEKKFSELIINWYQVNKRALPWRKTSDPYKIWLSEIILQQTRVNQGLPYYLNFIEKYPTVFDLAAASEQEVLRLWQGLGYYSRARNLHSCSKTIVEIHKGLFPSNYSALLKLKGIGSYTAAAIASFAFAEAVPVVDGNVFRVLARHFGIDKDISTAAGKEFFFKKASECIPPQQPAVFNQAIMEFGALNCTPQNPRCDDCVLKKSCVAFKEGNQSLFPVKTKKASVRTRYFYYFVIKKGSRFLMRERGPKDIWQGLYDFYLIETKRPTNVTKLAKSDTLLADLTVGKPSKPYKHILSHQHLFARFIPIEVESTNRKFINLANCGFNFYAQNQVDELPKPVLVSRYLADINFFTKL